MLISAREETGKHTYQSHLMLVRILWGLVHRFFSGLVRLHAYLKFNDWTIYSQSERFLSCCTLGPEDLR